MVLKRASAWLGGITTTPGKREKVEWSMPSSESSSAISPKSEMPMATRSRTSFELSTCSDTCGHGLAPRCAFSRASARGMKPRP